MFNAVDYIKDNRDTNIEVIRVVTPDKVDTKTSVCSEMLTGPVVDEE